MRDLSLAVERGFITEEQRVKWDEISAQYLAGFLSDKEYESALVALGVAVADEEANRV